MKLSLLILSLDLENYTINQMIDFIHEAVGKVSGTGRYFLAGNDDEVKEYMGVFPYGELGEPIGITQFADSLAGNPFEEHEQLIMTSNCSVGDINHLIDLMLAPGEAHLGKICLIAQEEDDKVFISEIIKSGKVDSLFLK